MSRSSTTDASVITVVHQPLDPQLALAAGVTTGSTPLAGTDHLAVGIWEHSAGSSIDVEQDEVFVVLHGRGRIHLDSGEILELVPGTVGSLAAGERTRWEIDEAIRKVWICSRTP